MPYRRPHRPELNGEVSRRGLGALPSASNVNEGNLRRRLRFKRRRDFAFQAESFSAQISRRLAWAWEAGRRRAPGRSDRQSHPTIGGVRCRRAMADDGPRADSFLRTLLLRVASFHKLPRTYFLLFSACLFHFLHALRRLGRRLRAHLRFSLTLCT